MRTALVIAVLLLPCSSLAQERADEPMDAAMQAELARLDGERGLGAGLTLAGGLTLGVGVAALLGGSIGSAVCMDDCLAANVAIGVGAGIAAIGLVVLIVGTFVAQGANERRRALLRELVAGTLTLRF